MMITPPSGRKATADIFILTKAGQLVATMIGVQFTELTMKVTSRALKAANKLSNEGPLPFEGDVPGAPSEQVIDGAINKLAKEEEKVENSSAPKREGQIAQATTEGGPDASLTMPQLREMLIQLVAENVGIDKSAIDINATFEDLGVDSLSLMDLGSEIEEKAGLEIDIASEHSVVSLLAQSAAPSGASLMVPTREVSHATSPIRSKGPQRDPDPAKPSGSRTKQEDNMIETVTYKTVDDLQIQADIYWPKAVPPEPMPIGKS